MAGQQTSHDYFFGDSSYDSISGPANDDFEKDFCKSEDEIAEYIRGSRPDLFKGLSGLPVRSYHITPASAIRRQIPQTPISRSSINDGLQFGPAYQDLSIGNNDNSSHSHVVHTSSSQQKLLDMQHKRHIQSRLLSKSRTY